MSEIVTTYLLSDLEQPLPMDRQEFYDSQIKEFKKNGKPNRAMEIVQILMFTPDKEIIVQKRSNSKAHNPGLIDKSIGGHITFGNTPNYTVLAETLQELQVPSIILNNKDEFGKTYKLLSNYLSTTSLLQYIDTKTMNLVRIINKEKYLIPHKYNLYFGIYGGPVRPADREAAGVLFYKIEQLKEEMQVAAALFTEDLRFYLDKYTSKIEEFLRIID